MKSKLKGSKKIAYVLIGAGAVALTGVAFSAWIITSTPETVNYDQITVTVGEVEDGSIKVLNAAADPEYGNLSFDAQSGDSVGPIVAGPNSMEQMIFKVSFDISGALSSQTQFTSWYGGFNTTLSIVTDDDSSSSLEINAAGSALNEAVSNHYLELPISDTVTFSKPETGLEHATNLEDSGNNGLTAAFSAEPNDGETGYNLHVVLTFTFTWGSAFGGSNPGLTTSTDDSVLTSIKNALTSLNKASGAHLNVGITPFLDNAD